MKERIIEWLSQLGPWWRRARWAANGVNLLLVSYILFVQHRWVTGLLLGTFLGAIQFGLHRQDRQMQRIVKMEFEWLERQRGIDGWRKERNGLGREDNADEDRLLH